MGYPERGETLASRSQYKMPIPLAVGSTGEQLHARAHWTHKGQSAGRLLEKRTGSTLHPAAPPSCSSCHGHVVNRVLRMLKNHSHQVWLLCLKGTFGSFVLLCLCKHGFLSWNALPTSPRLAHALLVNLSEGGCQMHRLWSQEGLGVEPGSAIHYAPSGKSLTAS